MCAVELICQYAPVGILDFPVKQSLATATAAAVVRHPEILDTWENSTWASIFGRKRRHAWINPNICWSFLGHCSLVVAISVL